MALVARRGGRGGGGGGGLLGELDGDADARSQRVVDAHVLAGANIHPAPGMTGERGAKQVSDTHVFTHTVQATDFL